MIALTHNLLLCYEHDLQQRHDLTNTAEDQRRNQRLDLAERTCTKIGSPIERTGTWLTLWTEDMANTFLFSIKALILAFRKLHALAQAALDLLGRRASSLSSRLPRMSSVNKSSEDLFKRPDRSFLSQEL